MKKLLYIFATAALTMTMSCGNSEKAGQSEKSVEDSLRADSIKKVEMAIEAQRQDSIRQDSIRQDSLRRYRVTPDLALFNLHGPVKSVTFNKGYYGEELRSATFSEDGTLQSTGSFKMKRNGNGLVTYLSGHYCGLTDNYSISYKGNKPISVRNEGHEWGGTSYLTYNNDGFVASESKSGVAECYTIKTSIKYKYTNVDKYGNWTARKKVRTNILIEDGLEDEPPTKEITTISEVRTITYYER